MSFFLFKVPNLIAKENKKAKTSRAPFVNNFIPLLINLNSFYHT
jgi:hypothetical protein